MNAVYGSLPRVRVRLSGVIFGLILFLGLMAALNTGFNLLYIVVAGLFSFIILSFILSFWTLARISMRRDAPGATHRGQPFLVATTIVNHKWLMPAVSLRIERIDRKGVSSGYILKLSGRSAARLNVREQLDRRGVYDLPGYALMTSFPFGLFEVRRHFRDRQEIIVYPRVSAVRTNVLERMPGARSAPRTSKDEGDEFFSLREYQLGDDVRQIAWRASARLGKWMVRELAQGTSREVIILLDMRIVPEVKDFDTHLEDAVDLAASLGLMLLKRQYQVGLVYPGEELEMGEGTAQQRKLLRMLAYAKAVSPREFPDFDSVSQNLMQYHATILYISPDPRAWGARRGTGELRALDPREIVHA